MSEATTERKYSENDLRDAGASALFIAYYKAAPESATARREVENGPFDLERLDEDPFIGGHFFGNLWEGNQQKAWSRADGRNRQIMQDAGLEPAGSR